MGVTLALARQDERQGGSRIGTGDSADARFGKLLVIISGIAGAGLVVALVPGQLHVQQRRLQGVDAEVAADQLVEIFRLHAVHTQDARLLGKLVIIGGEQAGITKAAEVLAREKAEAAKVPKAADTLALVA